MRCSIATTPWFRGSCCARTRLHPPQSAGRYRLCLDQSEAARMTADVLAAVEPSVVVGDSPWRQGWRRLAQRPAALVGLAIILFFIVVALAAALVAPYDPVATDWLSVRKAPSLRHLF